MRVKNKLYFYLFNTMNWEDNFKNVQKQFDNDNNITGYDYFNNNIQGNNYDESFTNDNYGGIDGMEKKYTLCDDMAKQQINRKMLDREMIASKGLPSHSNIQSFNSGIPTTIGWERPSSSSYVDKSSDINMSNTMFDNIVPRGCKVFDRCDNKFDTANRIEQINNYKNKSNNNENYGNHLGYKEQPQYRENHQQPLYFNERPQTNTRKISNVNEKMEQFRMFKSSDYYK